MGEIIRNLDHFMIGKSYGSNQEWMTDPWLRLGGCAAITACDTCINLSLYHHMNHLLPDSFNPRQITRCSYNRFAAIMKPYLRPRFSGIDRLDIFADGFGNYLKKQHMDDQLQMSLCPGNTDGRTAWELMRGQIDQKIPVPFLLLLHQDKAFHEYVWHWFLLNGYRINEDGERDVLAVTYGESEWLDFDRLWNTGHEKNGGMILYQLTKAG